MTTRAAEVAYLFRCAEKAKRELRIATESYRRAVAALDEVTAKLLKERGITR
jgi:hypothetical protein